MYLTLSWPDFAYVVHKLNQYMDKSCDTYLQALHYVLWYVKFSPYQDLFF